MGAATPRVQIQCDRRPRSVNFGETRANFGATGQAATAGPSVRSQVPGWLVGSLRLEVGHASTVRPDPSTLGVVGERGSRHKSR